MHKKLNPFRILRYAVLVFMTFITLYPPCSGLVYVLLNRARKSMDRPFGIPETARVGKLCGSLAGGRYSGSSVKQYLYAAAAVTVVVILSAMSAYIIAKVWKNRGLYHYYSWGIMIPINAIIIPFILIFRRVGILNTRVGVILAFIVTNLAFSIFILVPFMMGLPDELEDAARIGWLQQTADFLKIMLCRYRKQGWPQWEPLYLSIAGMIFFKPSYHIQTESDYSKPGLL